MDISKFKAGRVYFQNLGERVKLHVTMVSAMLMGPGVFLIDSYLFSWQILPSFLQLLVDLKDNQ